MNQFNLTQYKIEAVSPLCEDNVITIAFSSSDFFVPYLAVTLQSLFNHLNKDYFYDLVIFSKDISQQNKTILSSMCSVSKQVSLRFIDVSTVFDALHLYTVEHVTIETYFRLIIPYYMRKYHKILFLDSDLIIQQDISSLYQQDITNYALGACTEMLMSALIGLDRVNLTNYLQNTLHLKDMDSYFQGGVLLINIDYFNQHNSSEILMNKVLNFNYQIVDQDAMNEYFQGKVLFLPNHWNFPPMQKGMKILKFVENMSSQVREQYLDIHNPSIIHYAGKEKPWLDLYEELAYIWWQYARKTPFYEVILQRLNNQILDKKLKELANYRKLYWKYRRYCIKKYLSWGKTRQNCKQKIKELKEALQRIYEMKF